MLEIEYLQVISKTGEKSVCQRPIQKFEIATDNSERSNNEPVNDSKGADEAHILNTTRPTRKTKEEGHYLRELQIRQTGAVLKGM